MSVGIILMPQVLRDKLGDDGAEALVGLLNESKFVQKSDLDVVAERLEKKIIEVEGKIEKRIIEESNKMRSFVIAVNAVAVGLVTLMVTIIQIWAR